MQHHTIFRIRKVLFSTKAESRLAQLVCATNYDRRNAYEINSVYRNSGLPAFGNVHGHGPPDTNFSLSITNGNENFVGTSRLPAGRKTADRAC